MTRDGVLHVSALLRWEDKSVTPYWFPRQMRICVDGGPVTVGPQQGWSYLLLGAPKSFKGSLQAHGSAPVGAGSHDVRAQMRVLTNLSTAAVKTELTNCRLQIREGKA